MQNISEINIKEKVEILAQYIENDQDLGKAIRKLLLLEKPNQEPTFAKSEIKPKQKKEIVGFVAPTNDKQDFVVPKKTDYSFIDLNKCHAQLIKALFNYSSEELKSAIKYQQNELKRLTGLDKTPKKIKGFTVQRRIIKATLIFLQENVFNQTDERGYELANKYIKTIKEHKDKPIIKKDYCNYVIFTEYKKIQIDKNTHEFAVIGKPNRNMLLGDFSKKLFEEEYINRHQHRELIQHPYSIMKAKVRYNQIGKIEYERKALAIFALAPNGLELATLRAMELVIRKRENEAKLKAMKYLY